MEHDLQITQRCVTDDMGVDESQATIPHRIDHPIARAFAEKRALEPDGQETVTYLTAKQTVYSLHGGRWRGATWFDRDERVVWLLAARYHSSGDPDDAYPHFRTLDAEGRLLPTDEDYEALLAKRSSHVFLHLRQEAQESLSEAQRQPGEEVRLLLGGTFPVRILVEAANGVYQVWVVISQNLRDDGEVDPPADWLIHLLGFFFQGAAISELMADPGEYPGGPVTDADLVLTRVQF